MKVVRRTEKTVIVLVTLPDLMLLAEQAKREGQRFGDQDTPVRLAFDRHGKLRGSSRVYDVMADHDFTLRQVRRVVDAARKFCADNSLFPA